MPRWNRGKSQYLTHLKSTYPEYAERLDILNTKQRYVLAERLRGKTLKEVAQVLSLTVERIRQIEARACLTLIRRRGRPTQAVLPEELLKQHGFKEGETAYIEQKELPLKVAER